MVITGKSHLDQRSPLKRTFINTHPESISYICCFWILSDIYNHSQVFKAKDPTDDK